MLKNDVLHNICHLQYPAVDGTKRLHEQHFSEKNTFGLGQWGGGCSKFPIFCFMFLYSRQRFV